MAGSGLVTLATPTPKGSGSPSKETSWRPAAVNHDRIRGRRSGWERPLVQMTMPSEAIKAEIAGWSS